MTAKERRGVTEQDEALFREALKDARPIAHGRTPQDPPLKRARAKPVGLAPISTPPPVAPVYAQGKAEPIGGHRAAHMRKGRLEPEARLDLHGYRQEAAYRALYRFLGRARGVGNRVVLVVTGKGGVLKELLPKWLGEAEFKDLVAGISTAHAKHGGDGAFYVAIKRRREK